MQRSVFVPGALSILDTLTKKPRLFELSHHPFWDDPHISRQMLRLHLDPDTDTASRRHSTIDASVSWLVSHLNLKKATRVLDLGCGPGLYTSRFASHQLSVTGMDYSRSSIEYARAHSTGVKYILGNYLEMQFEDEFDVAFMIYCDFGALIDQQRDNLLHRVHRALTPGALFVFDVWTHEARKTRPHKSWTLKDGGFWSAKPYISLTETFCYPENDVYLDQHIVVADAEEARVYRVWDHVYSPDSIERVLCSNGFRVIELWEDLTGNPYDEHSRSIAVIAQVCKDFC